MGLFGFVKDIVLLPVDIASDVSGLGTLKKIVVDDEEGGPLMTVDRLKSMGKNINETYDK